MSPFVCAALAARVLPAATHQNNNTGSLSLSSQEGPRLLRAVGAHGGMERLFGLVRHW